MNAEVVATSRARAMKQGKRIGPVQSGPRGGAADAREPSGRGVYLRDG